VHRHFDSLRELEQFPQAFMAGTLDNGYLLKLLVPPTKSFEHRNQSIDCIERIVITQTRRTLRVIS
jgi:hypothetical protein